jgi:hypothetical protein
MLQLRWQGCDVLARPENLPLANHDRTPMFSEGSTAFHNPATSAFEVAIFVTDEDVASF